MVAIFVYSAKALAFIVAVFTKDCFVEADDVCVQCDSGNNRLYHTARLKRVGEGAIPETFEIIRCAVFRVEFGK